MRRPLRAAPLALLALCLPPPAHAEYKTTTAQAIAAHAEWLPYAPPPEAGAAAVCLVDTGVDLNPDTSSNVVARFALDGGDPGDLSESKHGTQMAMVMGAPNDGWGMVGVWPLVRIVSVRATYDHERFAYDAYAQAVNTCRRRALEYGIKVVAITSGGPSPFDDQRQRFADALAEAQAAGLNVVIAAGNTAGDVEEPGGAEPALTVGGSAPDGSVCSSSAHGGAVELFAPGCSLDTASADGTPTDQAAGTSQAASVAAGVVAALRSYGEQIAPEQAEAFVRDDASAADPSLSAKRAFSAAGLGSYVSNAEHRRADLGRTTSEASSMPVVRRPRLARIIWGKRRTRVRVVEIPPGRWAILRVFRGNRMIRAWRLSATRTITVRSPTTRVCVAFEEGPVERDLCRRRPK